MHTTSLLIAFALFAAVRSATEDEIFCARGLFACPPPKKFSFPENEEALDQVCSKTISFMSCMKRIHETCPNGDANRVSKFSETLAKLHVLCDKDSELHKAFVPHIGCLKDTLLSVNTSCSKLAKEIRNSAGFENVVENQEYIKFGCLYRLMEISCILTKVENSCGTSAEKALLDVVKEFEEENHFCPGTSLQEAAELIQVLEIEEKMKARFHQLKQIIQHQIQL